jgi:hypothetical protein
VAIGRIGPDFQPPPQHSAEFSRSVHVGFTAGSTRSPKMNALARLLSHAAAAAICTLAGAAQAQPATSTGACCIIASSGATTCSVVTREACEHARGRYRGNGVACNPDGSCPPLPPPPPPPTGACCVTDSAGVITCSVITERACRTAHGRYQGNAIACGAANACPPRGACCFAVGRCEVALQQRCAAAGGTYQTDGSTCRPTNPCPQPIRGACCLTERTYAYCLLATNARCTSASGAYQGDNIACTATLCPQPVVGACCIAATATIGARCTVGTAAACTAAAGTYGGDASTCRSANCPTSCPCDWDHSGLLNEHDAFAFLNDYLAGSADFNGDGVTNTQDLTDFRSCFYHPPAGCIRGRGR